MQVLQVQLEVTADPSEVGRARRWARSRLARSGIAIDEPIAETLILIISELVTNAVVHTGCPAVLRILLRGMPETPPSPGPASDVPPAPERSARGGAAQVRAAREDRTRAPAVGTVRVEVADASTRPPRPRRADGDETGGRGLALVDGLADRWGWEPSGAGKRIWCELDRSSGAGTAGTSAVRTRGESHQGRTAGSRTASYQGLAAYEAV